MMEICLSEWPRQYVAHLVWSGVGEIGARQLKRLVATNENTEDVIIPQCEGICSSLG